jgi:hypothetical protein
VTTVRMPVRVCLEVADDRVDKDLVHLVSDTVGTALTRAVDRALTVRAISESRQRPEVCCSVSFTGDALPDQVASALDAALRTGVDLAVARLVHAPLRDVEHPAPAGQGEQRDDDRVVLGVAGPAAYRVPYYDQFGHTVDVRLHGLTQSGGPRVDLQSTLARLQSDDITDRGIAMLEIHKQVTEGDETAVWLALMAIRADDASPTQVAIEALRDLWRHHPKRFSELIETFALAPPAALIVRDECDFKIDEMILQGFAPLLGAIDRLAHAIPEAKIGPGPGVGAVEALLGLLGAWREAWAELAKHLRESNETTDEQFLKAAEERPAHVQGFAGIIRTYSGDERIKRMLPELESDVRDATGLTFATSAAIVQLDGLLALYREAFGKGAAHQEEVKVLVETRTAALRALITCPLPRAPRLKEMQQELAEGLASWRTTAGGRRIARLRAAILEIDRDADQLQPISPYYERLMRDRPWEDVRVPFYGRAERLKLEIAGLGSELDLIAEDAYDLAKLLAIEAKVGIAAARVPVLGLYMATLELEGYMHEPSNIGSRNEHDRWMQLIDELRKKFVEEFDHPKLDPVPGQEELTQIARNIDWWHQDIERIAGELRSAQRRELIEGIAINIVALLITKKFVGLGGTAISITRVTFAEAAVFTAVSAFGQAVLLDKPTDPSKLLTETVDNFIMFGAFHVLGKVIEAGALAVFRGRPTAQLVAILGTQTVITTGLPILISRLQVAASGEPQEKLSEAEWASIATGVVLNGVMAAIGGRAMLTRLRGLAANELALEIAQLSPQTLKWATEFREFVDKPGSTAQFKALQKRGVQLCERLETALKRMSALPDEIHAQLGTTRNALANYADGMATWRQRFASMEYDPQAVPRLPAPSQAVGGALLVQRPGGVYEYDPAQPGSSPKLLEAKLKGAGYTVRSQGGGVLALSAGTGPPMFRLLPAPKPMLLLPAGTMSEAEALVLSAAGPGRAAVADLLRQPRGGAEVSHGAALLQVAEAQPELVRRAIAAEGAATKVEAGRLELALRDLALDKKLIDAALEAVAMANRARSAAEAAGPRTNLLVGAGGGMRAREVLATRDGRALVEAATLAPNETLGVLLVPPLATAGAKDVAIKAWQDRGLSAEKVLAATSALDRLIAAKLDTPLTVDAELAEAAKLSGWKTAIFEDMRNKDPAGYAALLRVTQEERALVRQAIRAEEQRTHVDAVSELVRRMQAAKASDAEITSVGNALGALNKIYRSTALEAEEYLKRAERAKDLVEEAGFRRDAPVVIQRWRSPRKERAQEWLDGHGMTSQIGLFVENVERSKLALDLAAHGGVTMLRQLWTMFRAGRTKWPKVQFPEYVEILHRIYRGLHGEYQFAFWVGEKYIVMKAPDAGVTVPGTDIILIPKGGGPPIWVDNKALSDLVVRRVTALGRNLPKNVNSDYEMFLKLLTSGHEYPPELLQALPLQAEANRRIQAITKKLSKDTVENDPIVRQQIADALKDLGIKRVVGVEGGRVEDLADDLKLLDKFEIWDEELD